MNNQKITVKYIANVLFVVLFTWFVHEFTHWLTSELLGYEAVMQLNGVRPQYGVHPTENHQAIIAISGPIITVLQGILCYFLLTKHWNKYLYPLLLTAFYMRFLAGAMNFLSPNDEARFGHYLGIGTHTLSIIISIFLFMLVYSISKKYKLGWKFQLWTILTILVMSWLIILVDQYFRFQIL
ncbi:hypothetical protein C8N46_11295 [Kordia periserrulae]|uniref:Peptidase M50B-like protein n=1 Tax=Kordia periserrulae TaxID=701523 RepID=A0A2T6BS40_9FLAO|nr:hypothetical protein [Kordia periserrulae]PTX58787.1 hypothetical protein C8N46_11295 [Kordia periserrulae]